MCCRRSPADSCALPGNARVRYTAWHRGSKTRFGILSGMCATLPHLTWMSLWRRKACAYRSASPKWQDALLFGKAKEQGLRGNAEEKQVEKIRWRAKKGGYYYFIDVNLTVKSIDDTYSTFDNELCDAFNYFRTKEQAEEAARRVRETLRKYHEEIGEWKRSVPVNTLPKAKAIYAFTKKWKQVPVLG